MFAPLLFIAAAAAPAPAVPQTPVAPPAPSAGPFIYNIFVDPQGRPFDCRVEMASAPEAAVQYCDQLMRTRFEPARDAAGKTSYSLLRALVAGKDAPALAPDLLLTVKPVPSMGGKAKDIEVVAEVGRDGRIAGCAPKGGARADAMVAAACAQLKAQWSGIALEDPQNSPRSYVRTLKVSFVPEG